MSPSCITGIAKCRYSLNRYFEREIVETTELMRHLGFLFVGVQINPPAEPRLIWRRGVFKIISKHEMCGRDIIITLLTQDDCEKGPTKDIWSLILERAFRIVGDLNNVQNNTDPE